MNLWLICSVVKSSSKTFSLLIGRLNLLISLFDHLAQVWIIWCVFIIEVSLIIIRYFCIIWFLRVWKGIFNNFSIPRFIVSLEYFQLSIWKKKTSFTELLAHYEEQNLYLSLKRLSLREYFWVIRFIWYITSALNLSRKFSFKISPFFYYYNI